MKRWIVWNKDKTEGVIFDDKADARFASDGVHRQFAVSALADQFRDLYAEDDPKVVLEMMEFTFPA